MRVLVLLAATVWLLWFAPPVSAGAPVCSQSSLQQWLPCLDEQASQATAQLRVTLPANLPIGPGKLALSRLAELRAAPLAVVVPEGVTTGQGGTMLLIAARTRYVGATSRLTYLSNGQFSDLGHAKMCDSVPKGTPNLPPGTVTICGLVHPEAGAAGTATGLDLLNTGLAQPVPLTSAPAPSTAPERHQPPAEPGHGVGTRIWLTMVLVLAVAVALIVLGLLNRRRLAGIVWWDRNKDGPERDDPLSAESAQPSVPSKPSGPSEEDALDSSPPRPMMAWPIANVEPVPPPGPRLPASAETVVDRPPAYGPDIAVVRTALHPQGYVEIEHCLRRVRWMDPHTPPPKPGQRVRISDVTADSGFLHAGPV